MALRWQGLATCGLCHGTRPILAIWLILPRHEGQSAHTHQGHQGKLSNPSLLPFNASFVILWPIQRKGNGRARKKGSRRREKHKEFKLQATIIRYVCCQSFFNWCFFFLNDATLVVISHMNIFVLIKPFLWEKVVYMRLRPYTKVYKRRTRITHQMDYLIVILYHKIQYGF